MKHCQESEYVDLRLMETDPEVRRLIIFNAVFQHNEK